MNQHISCRECKSSISQHGYKCVDCSNCFRKDIFYCRPCFASVHADGLQHQSTTVDYTETTNNLLVSGIIEFEKQHLSITTDIPTVFPSNDVERSAVWKRSDFSEISYLSPDEILLKNIIPYVCDYLRMNNSLKHLIQKLNVKLCSTDLIILTLKYSPFDIRTLVIEHLSMYQRAVPIYFGLPSRDSSSMEHYFLMYEMLHILLPYIHQKIPFVLSFGTQSCKEKTKLLNMILKSNFDCHSNTEFISEMASIYYHNQLIQLVLGHQYFTERNTNNEIECTFQCHALDLHGFHDWNRMPNIFIRFMSVIIIHMDASDSSQIDSFSWAAVTFNQIATYLIFIHGQTSDSKMKTDFEKQILKHFGSNKRNVHVLRAEEILKEDNKSLKLGVLNLLKQAKSPTDSLFNIPEELLRSHNLKLSTNINTVAKSRQLLDEFQKELERLSEDDPALDLFPLSRLKELSEKTFLSSVEEQQREQLKGKLHRQVFSHAHPVLVKLAELSIDHYNDMGLFEKAIFLWNTVVYQRKQQAGKKPPISTLQQLEMSKERFLREFQERSKGYTNLNGRYCSFGDSGQMKTALIKIYRHSFHRQEYIEIINATSSSIYPDIFEDAFSNDFDLRNFFVVGILGEQSSGKSFAVNKVFGTKIAESKFKCTTGILATRVHVTGHEKVKDIVILDTEGLLDQSKKNGEAQIFDRKIVLEVMARSHVVLINITRNINKTMQQILEIVLYGFNKLQITNKPKLIFLFRDQDPRTMGEAGQRNHIDEVINDIERACGKVHFNVRNIIHGVDIHEFPSPFVDLLVGEREISFFSNSFCQKALALRLKIIDHLNNLSPFESFSGWITVTLDLWHQINQNSNLFDYESLVHLTLEKALERFCNVVLTEANSQMRTVISGILQTKTETMSDDNRILLEIKQELAKKKNSLADKLSHQLTDEKKKLMELHNLETFPEALWENTQLRIKSCLDRYEIDHCMAATRQFQQDEFQKKLSDMPNDLSKKIRDIQSVSENTDQFETLFENTSKALLRDFEQMLNNDYKKQATSRQYQLIQNFLNQNKIDNVGVNYFLEHISDSSLKVIVRKAVIGEDSRSADEYSSSSATTPRAQLAQAIPHSAATTQHGRGFFTDLALRFYNWLLSKIKHDSTDVQTFTEMFALLKKDYTMFHNSPYYDSNLLPIPEVANLSVQHLTKHIEESKITNQQIRNIWYTCYGIMLNIFCDEHRKYITEKLLSDFKQEIIRTQEIVKQSIINASTAEEHGQALIKQIWAIIQNDIQKHFQEDFESFFSTWNEYRPSLISENCVNQLFRSIHYQKMFTYIQRPTNYVNHWLLEQFNEKYQKSIKSN